MKSDYRQKILVLFNYKYGETVWKTKSLFNTIYI